MMTSTFRSASQAVLLALACTGTPSLAAQGTLRGRVIDSEMGNPIVGAVVRIGTDGLSFTTDSSGRFQASGLPNGTLPISLSITRPRRVPWAARLGVPVQARASKTAWEALRNVDVIMQRPL